MMTMHERELLKIELEVPINVALQKALAVEIIGACKNTWNSWVMQEDNLLGGVDRAKVMFDELCHLPMIDIIQRNGLQHTALYNLIRHELTIIEVDTGKGASRNIKDWKFNVTGSLAALLAGNLRDLWLIPGYFWNDKSEAEVRDYYHQLLHKTVLI